jgi:serine-type D-Ala-D-Ala carboxypeptidase (penicillin-binding protein 5/6)
MRLRAHLVAIAAAPGIAVLGPFAAAHAATPVRTKTALAATAPTGIAAKGATLFDAGTNKELWSNAPASKRPVGSMTKALTALVVLKSTSLSKVVTIKQSYVDHARNNDGSTANLKVGDKIPVRSLLNAMMLPSGCDAAYALADVVGPGQSKFVAKMNSTAASLGMTKSHFLTSDGLPTSSKQEGYATPRDVIKLGTAAMANADLRAIVNRTSYSLAKNGSHAGYTWSNTNLLLGSYSGAVGIKTGHTDGAGYCLLFQAQRNGRTLIGVVLNSTTTDTNRRFKDAAAMLDWGFGTATPALKLRSLPAGAPKD